MKKSGTSSAYRTSHAASNKLDPDMLARNAGLGKPLGLGMSKKSGGGLIILSDEGAEATSTFDGLITPMNKGFTNRHEGRMALGDLSSVTKPRKQEWAPGVHGRKEKSGLLNSNAKKIVPFKIWTDSEEESASSNQEEQQEEEPISTNEAKSASLAVEVNELESEISASLEDYPGLEKMQMVPSDDMIEYYNSEPPEQTQYISSDDITLECGNMGFTFPSERVASSVFEAAEEDDAATVNHQGSFTFDDNGSQDPIKITAITGTRTE